MSPFITHPQSRRCDGCELRYEIDNMTLVLFLSARLFSDYFMFIFTIPVKSPLPDAFTLKVPEVPFFAFTITSAIPLNASRS